MTKKHRIAAEVFGIPIEHYTDKAFFQAVADGGFMSPFTNLPNKKLTRMLDIPLGIDSVYCDGVPVIIDPSRFLQDDIIFKDIATKFWGSMDNVIKIPEVGLNGIGRFDYILVKHKPLSNDIEDFIIIEIQSDSTTGTGALVKNLDDLRKYGYGGLKNSYAFGMNTYNTIKLSFIQMLLKGVVAEKWGKNCVWVMQDYVYSNMLKRFDIQNNDFSDEKHTHYFIYGMERKDDEDIYHLRLDTTSSYTTAELLRAFDGGRTLPDIDIFMDTLESRLLKELKT